MQIWPIDILRHVFSLVPNQIPRIASVCRRFRFVENDEMLWAVKLKTRFNITEIPPGSLYKDYYKLCFQSMQRLRCFICPVSQQNMGGARPLPSGFTTEMSQRVDDTHFLEIDRNILTLKNRTQIVRRWTLAPSTYYIELVHDPYWIVQSPVSTYFLDLKKLTCDLLANAQVGVFIRCDYLFTLGETSLNVHNLAYKTLVYAGIIFFNNKKHIYHLEEGEIACITNQQQLILIRNEIKIYQMPSFFEPQSRLNETQLIVNVNNASCLFDLAALQVIPVDLGIFSFRTHASVAFCKNGELIICDEKLKFLFKYPLPENHDILHLDPRFVLLKPTQEPNALRSAFKLLNLNRPDLFEFTRRSTLIYIGSEGFYLLFARLNATTLEIMCFNPLNLEFFTPIRLIQNYQFRSATRITNCMEGFRGDYLVVSYFEYTIKVQAVLRSYTGEYKISTYQYKY